MLLNFGRLSEVRPWYDITRSVKKEIKFKNCAGFLKMFKNCNTWWNEIILLLVVREVEWLLMRDVCVRIGPIIIWTLSCGRKLFVEVVVARACGLREHEQHNRQQQRHFQHVVDILAYSSSNIQLRISSDGSGLLYSFRVGLFSFFSKVADGCRKIRPLPFVHHCDDE